MAISNSAESRLCKGKLVGARAVFVYFLSTVRNEWIDWNGNTDKVRRILPVPFASVDEAQKAAERNRTPGSAFCIRQSVALFLEFDLGASLFYESDREPLKSLKKVRGTNSAKHVFNALLSAIKTATRSPFLFQQAYLMKNTPHFADFKQGEAFYSRTSSGSGNKKNGLAWTLTPESVIPDAVRMLVTNICAAITAEAEFSKDKSIEKNASSSEQLRGKTLESAETETLDSETLAKSLGSSLVSWTQPEVTTQEQLTLARVGQGLFRERLEAIEIGCRLTGLQKKLHLIASHIKPWRDCSDIERLDGNNGLLLSPHVDHLFDNGYISFSDDGSVLLSVTLESSVLEAWHLDLTNHIRPFTARQKSYMDYHRAFIFKG